MDANILTIEKPRKNINIDHIRRNMGFRYSETKRPTKATIEAMEETMNDIKNGNIKVFDNSDDLMNDLLAD
jgi:hypothetical protein